MEVSSMLLFIFGIAIILVLFDSWRISKIERYLETKFGADLDSSEGVKR